MIAQALNCLPPTLKPGTAYDFLFSGEAETELTIAEQYDGSAFPGQ
jgi:hypothetical protein